MSDKDEQDEIDSESQYALLTAAIGGDALAHIAFAAGMKNVFDYTKPNDHKEAMATPDAEEWAKKMNVKIDFINTTDLRSDYQRSGTLTASSSASG